MTTLHHVCVVIKTEITICCMSGLLLPEACRIFASALWALVLLWALTGHAQALLCFADCDIFSLYYFNCGPALDGIHFFIYIIFLGSLFF